MAHDRLGKRKGTRVDKFVEWRRAREGWLHRLAAGQSVPATQVHELLLSEPQELQKPAPRPKKVEQQRVVSRPQKSVPKPHHQPSLESQKPPQPRPPKGTQRMENPNQNKRKRKHQGPESEWRGKLDMCTKLRDVGGALRLVQEGVDGGYRFQARNFNQVLYLCAAAASGEPESGSPEASEKGGIAGASQNGGMAGASDGPGVSEASERGIVEDSRQGEEGTAGDESVVDKGWEVYELMQQVRTPLI